MSLTDFTVYKADGSIVRTGACPEDQCDAQADTVNGEYVLYTKTDIQTDRIDVTTPVSPVPVAKQPNTITINKTSFIANGTDVVHLANVPANSKVSIIPDESLKLTPVLDQLVTDGWVEVTTTQAGNYTITIDNGVLLSYEVIINAV